MSKEALGWDECRREMLSRRNAPVSFVCGDRPPGEARDPKGGAPSVRIDGPARVFPDRACVEWAPRLRNEGPTDSPRLSELRSLDIVLASATARSPVTLHAARGCCNEGFTPYAVERIFLRRGMTWRAGNPSGGKSNDWLPFVNIETEGRGLFVALGWPGRWTLTVERRSDGSMRVAGGLEKADLSLRPGETISLPTVLVMFWEGDRAAAHNRFRRHILEHHTPTCEGKPVPDLLSCCTWGGMKTEKHLGLIEELKRRQAPFDCYWVDAGWYGPERPTTEFQHIRNADWFFTVGDWRVNPATHPRGLRPIGDAARAAGMKFLLWFEVERAIEDCPWFREHPGWFFRTRHEASSPKYSCVWRVFNFGIPEARQAMTDWMARLIEEYGVDVYRQDCNIPLNDSWDGEDEPGRAGISEIRYVEGLLAFWDGLRERFPRLVFDVVQRRDLSTISRALDLSRSDHEFMPDTDVIASQCAIQGLSHWMPLSGTGVPKAPGNDYFALSGLSPSFGLGVMPALSYEPIEVKLPPDYPWDWLVRILGVCRRARPFFRGDFYPLMEYVHSNDHWGAMQFHRPDLGSGMALVYRRPASSCTRARFRLGGLKPEQTVRVEETVGATARGDGEVLEVDMASAPLAGVVFYRC